MFAVSESGEMPGFLGVFNFASGAPVADFGHLICRIYFAQGAPSPPADALVF
jgi:hypothetical protein